MTGDNEFNASLSEELTVEAEDKSLRIDAYLTQTLAGFSRNRIQALIEEGRVKVNEALCEDKNYRLKEGDRVRIKVPPPKESLISAEDIQLDIIYEDSDLLVINKPRGMVVHPGPGHSGGTMVNALLAYCSDLSGIGGVMRPGIVHRLDKDTSGLLIVAKNDPAHRALSGQLKARKISREYIALVHGRVNPEIGRLEAPIARHPKDRKKMAVVKGGREAVTRYRVLKYYNRYSLLKLNLETGRTHQIRVHLSYLGYPVVGDMVYAKAGKGDLPACLDLPQALHAFRLSFNHPCTKERLKFSAPLPEEFRAALVWLKGE